MLMILFSYSKHLWQCKYCWFLQKFGLKYYLRNPCSYTPLRKSYWRSEAKSLTLSQDASFNYEQISKFSQHDAEVFFHAIYLFVFFSGSKSNTKVWNFIMLQKYHQYEKKLENFVDCIQPLMDISPTSLAQLFSKEVPLTTKLNLIKSKDTRDAGQHFHQIFTIFLSYFLTRF